MTTNLQTLFKKTSTGAEQEWTIGVEGNVIVTRFGKVGGKIQEVRDEIKIGKNSGKANATSPEEQAHSEAQSQWEKKLKKGYVKNLKDAQKGKTDAVIEGGVFPMLAHRFDQHGHKVQYPAFTQPKFDGHRCIAVVAAGKATLWTRTRKSIVGLPHIVSDLEKFSEDAGVADVVLDGELYNHSYRNKFEELTSFIRNSEPKEGHQVVQYHVYDAVLDGTFAERTHTLKGFLSATGGQPSLIAVETVEVADEEELMLAFERFLEQGYEGAMVRNAAGLYEENRRSYDLLKVKEFIDSEFKVVAVEEGRGKLTGHAIFVCELPDGVTRFGAKMKGATTDLKQYFHNPKLAIGRQLTVQFQGYTAKNGVPRFPVALRFAEKL